KGFGATGQNTVVFNGTPAAVAQSSSNRIITTVPATATTGSITVTAPLGSAISPRPFRVVGALAVSPLTVTLGEGATEPFVAREGGLEPTNAVWSVEGLVGGDAFVGTISPQGLYVVPASITTSRRVTVAATSRDDASVTATATVTLAPPVLRF